MAKSKKGMEYYYIIFSLIIGLILLGIFFIWLYQEYFTEQDVDLQICRQSVEARAAIPNLGIYERNLVSLKGDYPLKCKTEVIVIDYEDVSKLEREIANTIAGCWNLFGEGKKDIFPSQAYSLHSVCVPCARIHINPAVREYYSDKEIIISRGLEQPFKGGTYLSYLNQGDGPFAAFSPGNARPFILDAAEFRVDDNDWNDGVFYNRISEVREGEGWFDDFNVARVDLPREFDPQNGDLVIYYAHGISGFDSGIGNYFPYMFYFHTKDNYKAEFDNMLIDGPAKWNIDMCEMQEGIPA